MSHPSNRWKTARVPRCWPRGAPPEGSCFPSPGQDAPQSIGEKTDEKLYFLISKLMGRSGLSEEDVSRLLKGTYPMYRSPFLAMVTGKGYTVTIVADLDGNPHLQNLP